jgi:hypothetical protein
MRRFLMSGLAALAVACMPVRGAPQDNPQAKAAAQKTPKEQFQAVLDEYQKAMADFSEAYSKAGTDAERSKIATDRYPKPESYAARFQAIADAAPGDPVAVEALIWTIQLGFTTNPTKAMRQLAEQHADSPKLASLTQQLAYSNSADAERLLRAIIDKNRDRTARAGATLALAQYLNGKITLIRSLNDGKLGPGQTVDRLLNTQGYDKDGIARLKAADTGAMLKEVESLFEKVQKEFGDVNLGREPLAKTAANELNEIRNLGVGKPCPEISGQDVDGKPLKLSDYRGKVVVVDFWGDW